MNGLRLPLFVGLRYVRSKQREGFFSLVSALSFGAMTLGVIALIVVLSVMNGFDREIKQRILNVVPHITVNGLQPEAWWQQHAARLQTLPGVTGVAAYGEGQGMLSAGSGLEGVSLQAVDATASGPVALLGEHMVAGSLDALAPGEYGVVIGSLLARSLRVMTGDQVLLTLPELTVTPVGVFPRTRRLQVVGIYQVGAQVDTGIALVHMSDFQALRREQGQIQGLRLSLEDPFALTSVLDALQQRLPGDVRITTWQQSMSALFQAISMEKKVVGLLLTIIIAVAAFNIVASLVLMVANKRKDIAVLRAMGATGTTISRIFRIQGTVVGVSGVALGVLAGCLLAWWLGDIVAFFERLTGRHVFDPSVYFINRIPTDIQWPDVVIVATLGILISVLATLYPAYRAGRVSPAEILRYDH